MAAVETTRNSAMVGLAAPQPSFSFAALIAAVQKWNESRITRKALSKLSDRELADIGLTRFDIDTL